MLNFNNSLSEGFQYNPTSGLLIGGNLLTFLFCLLGVGILFAILAKPLKLQTEISDIIFLGLAFVIVSILTKNTTFIHGDIQILSNIFNIFSIIFKRALKLLGIEGETVIIVTSFTILLFNFVTQQVLTVENIINLLWKFSDFRNLLF